MGFSIDDLDHVSTGMVFDCMSENINDDLKYDLLPTQEDFDNF